MLWRVAAKTYIDTRQKLDRMPEADFLAYHEKWKPKARRGLQEAEYKKDSNLAAKWEGFNDALIDSYDIRYAADSIPVDEWYAEALRYLYEERETP
jgi:hypothetical protein